MIKEYDDMICNFFTWDSKNERINQIEKFQNNLAFFVENEEWRKEDENYYGVVELNKYVKDFLDFLKK